MLAIDIIGVGPIRGMVRWAQAGKFGVQFEGNFDLGRLAARKEKTADSQAMRSWYTERREAAR
jgi:hypothetical protein